MEASPLNLHGTATIHSNGHLAIGGCDATDLARRFGTPLWVVDEELFRSNCRAYREAFGSPSLFPAGAEVVYASKSLSALAICRIVDEEGLSLDVVSGGELYTARLAGFPPPRVCFHGNNKSPDELKEGLVAGIGRFMVDNLDELETLNSLAAVLGLTADVVLRVSPGIETNTHAYLQTGQVDSKFGLPIETGQAFQAVERALALDRISLRGLHCHVGSQIFRVETHAHAATVLVEFAAAVRDRTGWVSEEINLGGGFGIRYTGTDGTPEPVDYAAAISLAVAEGVARYDLPWPKVLIEPGRAICAQAGWTLYTTGAVKEIPGVRDYVSVDGGMGDNPRPALYQATYEACLVNRANEPEGGLFTIAGKCCESGDILIWDVPMPRPRPGDILAVSCTGAYNYTMSMNYNRLPRPAMVLVSGGQAEVIVERETYADLVARERVPERLAAPRPRVVQKTRRS